MFELTRLKLKTFIESKKRKDKVFVNPYTNNLPNVNSKLNPYSTDYGTKKPRSMQDLIYEKIKKNVASKSEVPVVESILPVIKEPSFFADMKNVFIGDLMWIARRKQTQPIVEEEFSIYESDAT